MASDPDCRTIEELLQKLQGVHTNGSGWMACCPAHDDSTPSLSINQGEVGRVLLKCFAGCPTEAVVAALGMKMRDLFLEGDDAWKTETEYPAFASKSGGGGGFPPFDWENHIVFEYRDEKGHLLSEKLKDRNKNFMQRKPNPGYDGTIHTKRHVYKLNEIEPTLFRLESISKLDPSEPVLVVEGEKDVQRVWSSGLAATCSRSTSEKDVDRTDWSPLKGRKVIIVPDNDPVGEKYAALVARNVQIYASELTICRLPDLEPKGDVSDFLDANTVDALKAALAQAEPFSVKAEEREPGTQEVAWYDDDESYPRYDYRGDGTYYLTQTMTKNGPLVSESKVCNFSARILRTVEVEDSEVKEWTHDLETTFRGKRKVIEVTDAQLNDPTSFISLIDSRCSIAPQKKGHVSQSIREAPSDDFEHDFVYASSGWKTIDGERCFLFSGGAITPNGLREDIEVDLGSEAFKNYRFERVATDDEVRSLAGPVLRLLDHGKNKVNLPLFCSMFSTPLGLRTTSWYTGKTETGKTHLVALFLNFFGSEWTVDNLPGSWAASAAWGRAALHSLRHLPLVMDDYKVDASSKDPQALSRIANEMVTSVYNGSHAGRANPDGTARESKPPQSSLISTGETTFSGESAHTRMVEVILSKNYAETFDQTIYEEAIARRSEFAPFMASYLQWAAQNYETVVASIPEQEARFRKLIEKRLREFAAANGENASQFARPAGVLTRLLLGGINLFKFLYEKGAISNSDFSKLSELLIDDLVRATVAKRAEIDANRHERSCLDAIRSLLDSKKAHLADASDGTEPRTPIVCGWSKRQGKDGSVYEPKGDCIGWIDSNYVYLDWKTTHRVLLREFRHDEFVHLGDRVLLRQLKEQQMLAKTDGPNNCPKKTIAGKSKRVAWLHAEAILGESEEPEVDLFVPMEAPSDPVTFDDVDDLWGGAA